MAIIRETVNNPELILSAIAVHAVFALFAKIMKQTIDSSFKKSGMTNLILTEILASFMFVACIMEKGLWFENVNEVYFHFATAAQVIFWMTHLPGAANPLPILENYGIVTMMIVFIFQIVGGLAGASFIAKVFWPQGFIPFHQTITTGQCTNTMNTDQQTGIMIESGLVLVFAFLPELEKKIGKALNFNEGNTVMVCQAVIVAYVVKTFIRVTGAMMNPLLAVVVNFHCLNSPADMVEHMTHYWVGPMAVVLILGFLKKSKKRKLD